MDINASRGMRSGSSEEKVRQVADWRASALFSEMERDALEYDELSRRSKRCSECLRQ